MSEPNNDETPGLNMSNVTEAEGEVHELVDRYGIAGVTACMQSHPDLRAEPEPEPEPEAGEPEPAGLLTEAERAKGVVDYLASEVAALRSERNWILTQALEFQSLAERFSARLAERARFGRTGHEFVDHDCLVDACRVTRDARPTGEPDSTDGIG